MKKVVPVHRAKTWPCRFKRLARVILKYLNIWRPFLKSGTPKNIDEDHFGQIYRRLRCCFGRLKHLRMLRMCQLVLGRGGKNIQTVYMEKSLLAPQGHPTFKASDPPPRVTLPSEPTLQFLI